MGLVQAMPRAETQDAMEARLVRVVLKIADIVHRLIPSAGMRSVMDKKRARLALAIAGNALVRICTYATQTATVYTIVRT